jgi:hypothetical protein
MMKISLWRQNAILALLLLPCPLIVRAQRTTQQIYAGFSYVRTDDQPNVNAFGWEAGYSEYPYKTFYWLGATLAATGDYAGPVVNAAGQDVHGLLHNQIYTYMGGPSVQGRSYFHHYRPFAHVLLGAVITDVSTTGRGQAYFGSPISESTTGFGMAIGGGVDYYLNHALSLRGGADWLRSSFQDQNLDRQNSVRASGGLVMKF